MFFALLKSRLLEIYAKTKSDGKIKAEEINKGSSISLFLRIKGVVTLTAINIKNAAHTAEIAGHKGK
jgi:hypothetical protein